MSNSVSDRTVGARWGGADAGLYAPGGARKYLNRAERQRALAVMETLEPDRALFALTLAWTGARVSEVLALTAASFQVESGVVALLTLKRRRPSVREVPIPPSLIAALDGHFRLSLRQRNPMMARQRIFPWSRVTAWRIIKRVMERSGISGCHACPKAFRHAFGVGTLQSSIPINLTQRWLGHSRVSTTAIYAAACGPEEVAFAERFWRACDHGLAPPPNPLCTPGHASAEH